MLRRKKNRGQSTAEYAILIGVVIGALIAMQAFVGRNIKAKIHDVFSYRDPDLPEGLFTTEQYEPGIAGTTTTISNRKFDLGLTDAGVYSRENIDEASKRTGNQTIPGVDSSNPPPEDR